MRYAALILTLCALVPLANTACWRTERKAQGQDPCLDPVDQESYPVGSTWRSSQCQRCTCSKSGMECCDMMKRPVGYPADCEVLYDWTECTYKLVKKNGPCIWDPRSEVMGK
ncbi:beta-microseminoprotein-like isoform X3 [Clupea harengus]|uniref:Beta-microseminoprotein-like isoform X3 n=1 Tax=Clupea harengus TaxID=7950 RepID=A0A6P8FQI2_CLUHA|nr:beta-microseminoprotein-like isoform X3 [Clupea harengus]